MHKTAIALPALLLALAVATPGVTDHRAPAYEHMTRIDDYLMSDPNAEIALARSAAPAGISAQATVLALKPQGYATVATGSNGFTCLVERGWTSPFDSPDFWNPKLRGPVCYNAAAAKSVLAYSMRRTKLALAGLSKAQMLDEVRAATARNELPLPQPGSMSFMMSKDGYLGDGVGNWHSHLMFHVPKADAESWGANLPGSPVILDTVHGEFPEPETTFMVAVGHWSDGSAAPEHD